MEYICTNSFICKFYGRHYVVGSEISQRHYMNLTIDERKNFKRKEENSCDDSPLSDSVYIPPSVSYDDGPSYDSSPSSDDSGFNDFGGGDTGGGGSTGDW